MIHLLLAALFLGLSFSGKAPTNAPSNPPTSAPPTSAHPTSAPPSAPTSPPSAPTSPPSAPTNPPSAPTKPPSAPTNPPSAPTNPPTAVSTAPTPAPTSLPTAPPTAPPTLPSNFKGDKSGHLSLNSFSPYPNTAGVNVTGYVLLSHDMESLTISYQLMGVDEACTTRDPDTFNSCGMHIHVGFSCYSDNLVGIHYWNQGSPEAPVPDPWTKGPSFYQYDSTTKMAKGEIVMTNYGFGVDPTKGHAFVIHNKAGVRIACGVLPSTTDQVSLGHLAPYPMYEGPLKNVTGCVNLAFRGVSVELEYNLTGVDPLCASPNPDIPLSCGLHIHSGMTCTNASEVGGHYYDAHYFPSPLTAPADPWLNTPITFNVETGMAVGSLQVDFGFGFDTSRGRAVVLHDYNGTRIACAPLPMYADRVTGPLPALAPYPGYEGTPITGSVKVDFRGKAVKIMYNLQGTEPECASGVPGPSPNSCGIHIHSGLMCAEAGGHYFNPEKLHVDPWAVATYKSQVGENSLIVGYGYSFDQSQGRTVVIHSYNGTRVACANIPATSSFAAAVTDFKPLPAAITSITPTSTVLFDFRPTSVRMSYNLVGVEPACAKQGAAPNSCGVHIHEGYSCSEPGKHYYSTATDPWTSDRYVANSEGNAMGYIDVEYGYSFADARGRTVVIHNYAGTPVACSNLPSASDFTDHAGLSKMLPLPGATVPVTGTVLLSVSGLGVKMEYALTEVEPMCASVGPAPLSCGIHIHKGFSCEEALTHFYNNVTYPADPWMYSSYTASNTTAYGSVVVSYGESWAATEGRVVVLHNYAGEKVSCAVIPQTTDRVTATGFRYLTNPSTVPGDVLLDFRMTSVLMTYHLTNVDPGCAEPAPGVANSCGIHIHTGTSCAEASVVGGHYFDNHTFSTDPWAAVVYKSDSLGNAMGMVNVEYGYGYEMTKGRVVVIHDKNGTKVFCAPIPAKSGNEEMSVTVNTMGKYPEYEGPYTVGVQAISLGFKGMGTRITYNLTGVPCECSQMGTAPNSCGLHIHDGTSCADPKTILGHWFNKTMIADDPWATATYTSTGCASTCLERAVGSTASGAITVDFGYGPGQTLDKVLVVHDYLGNRIGCTPISNMHPTPRDLDMTGMVSLASFGPYPSAGVSAPTVNVTGAVQLHFDGPKVNISYRVHGLDPKCVEGGRTSVLNSCGMHIHRGWSCENPTAVGGHYYRQNLSGATPDPWQESYYVVGADGLAAGSVSVQFGYTVDETKGRAFVFHDVNGVPMTCTVTGSTTDKVTLGAIMPLPNYSGANRGTEGCVNLEFRGTSVQLSFNLTKLDPACASGPSDAPNSCGIHIHTGTSCDNSSAAGKHLYDNTTYPDDDEPWKKVSYRTDQEGRAMTSMNVEFGYGFDRSQGHAFVIHDHNGSMMTCNLIPVSAERDMAALPPLQPIVGSTSPVKIEGSVKLDFRGRGVKITYDLTGIEPSCAAPGPNPNSCGIHIHSGFSCDNPEGHYFNHTLFPSDPWSSAVYTVTPTPMPGSLIVSYGFDFEHSKGRTVVVHDYSGAKVACAVIPATTDRATANNFVKLDATSVVSGEATLDFRASSVRITYNLSHVDQRCDSRSEAPNSCGLHIHEGMSCASAETPGPHFYNKEILTADPWANVTYHAVEGAAVGMVDVEFGFGYLQSRGRTLVVHNQDGVKVACAVISTGNAARDTVGVVSFMPLQTTPIEGKVLVDFRGMGVRLSYDLTGVETNCSSVGPAKLSCGIHIHQGFNCSEPMGHYYNQVSYPSDPWMYSSYTALGNSARGSLVVSYGEDYAHSMGRSLVLHNYAGEKVACQTIPQITDNVLVGNFKPMNDVPKNETMVSGTVDLAFRATSVRMTYSLMHADPRCVAKNPAKDNSCGLHIHMGSCLTPEGHYYDHAAFMTNPWANVTYASNAEGVAQGVVNVEFGYGYELTRGKIVIIHDQDGLLVSCAEISASAILATTTGVGSMKKYPAYEGVYTPTLEAHMKYTREAVTISYNLTGVPCECSQIGTAPNSCGLHIHEGTSCSSNSLVLGHWFGNVSSDPWAYTPYIAQKCSEVCTSDSFGTTASGSLTVVYGKDYASTMNRVLVVHDYMGTRIGCAPLMGVPQINPQKAPSMPMLEIVLGAAGGVLFLLLLILYCRHRRAQRGRVGALNEKLAPTAAPPLVPASQNPTRRTLSVNHM